MIRLVFWVFGDDCGHTIGVDMALDKDVGDLKEAIKERKKKTFKSEQSMEGFCPFR
jgi:hypothetical protein